MSTGLPTGFDDLVAKLGGGNKNFDAGGAEGDFGTGSGAPGTAAGTGGGGGSGTTVIGQPFNQTTPTAVPSPADPGGMLLWHQVLIGDWTLPPNPNFGSVDVEVESGGAKDNKKAAGKSKSNTTKQGAEDCKIKIKCEWVASAWGDDPRVGYGWETALTGLDPDGPNAGGPFTFSHPDADRRGVKAVMVDKMGAIKLKGYHMSIEIECKEWTQPNAPGTTNQTTTPAADKGSTGSGGGANDKLANKFDAGGAGSDFTVNPKPGAGP